MSFENYYKNFYNNLYDEIVEKLEEHNKNINDIVWVGTRNYKIDKTKFLEDAKKLYYDDGYGLSVINEDLLIVGKGWYLERWEYDGSEGFRYISLIEEPKETREYSRDFIVPETYIRDYKWEN